MVKQSSVDKDDRKERQGVGKVDGEYRRKQERERRKAMGTM